MQEDRIVRKIEGLENPIWFTLPDDVHEHMMMNIKEMVFDQMWNEIFEKMEIKWVRWWQDKSKCLWYPYINAYNIAKEMMFSFIRDRVKPIMLTNKNHYRWMKKNFDWYRIYQLGNISFFEENVKKMIHPKFTMLRRSKNPYCLGLIVFKRTLFKVTTRKLPNCLLTSGAKKELEHNLWVRVNTVSFYFLFVNYEGYLIFIYRSFVRILTIF